MVTTDGKTISGILRDDSRDELVLALDAKQTQRIAKADVEEILPGKVSVMPAGLDTQLTHQELADLLAFLQAAK